MCGWNWLRHMTHELTSTGSIHTGKALIWRESAVKGQEDEQRSGWMDGERKKKEREVDWGRRVSEWEREGQHWNSRRRAAESLSSSLSDWAPEIRGVSQQRLFPFSLSLCSSHHFYLLPSIPVTPELLTCCHHTKYPPIKWVALCFCLVIQQFNSLKTAAVMFDPHSLCKKVWDRRV